MDHTEKSLRFKAEKALRYVRLYGPRRALTKIQSQYHMKRTFESTPIAPAHPSPGGHIGLIGCGNFGFSQIAYQLCRDFPGSLRACMDADLNRAGSLAQSYRLRYFTDQADRLLDDSEIDLVFISSNHATHAEYAIRALEAGKSVHIEKPHCVDFEQLEQLCEVMERTEGKMALGFNRPQSRFGREIKRHLDEEPGSVMLNWFVSGHRIEAGNWYFRRGEGGRVLGNLSHWIDFVYQMIPAEHRYPITIVPTRAEQADCNIGVNFVFGDGSIATTTFSAKGDSFEGVRERLTAHKGDTLVFMDDYQRLTIERGARKKHWRNFFRDHGHAARIHRSYALSRGGTGESVQYVWEIGELCLRAKDALERNQEIVVEGFAAREGTTGNQTETEPQLARVGTTG